MEQHILHFHLALNIYMILIDEVDDDKSDYLFLSPLELELALYSNVSATLLYILSSLSSPDHMPLFLILNLLQEL